MASFQMASFQSASFQKAFAVVRFGLVPCSCILALVVLLTMAKLERPPLTSSGPSLTSPTSDAESSKMPPFKSALDVRHCNIASRFDLPGQLVNYKWIPFKNTNPEAELLYEIGKGGPASWFENQTIFLVGDSQERHVSMRLCKQLQGKYQSVEWTEGTGERAPIAKLIGWNSSAMVEQGRPHLCHIAKYNTSVVQFFIFGLTSHTAEIGDRPHHKLTWETYETLERLQYLVRITRAIQRQPTAIVLNSALWDLANWGRDGELKGNPKELPRELLDEWLLGASGMVEALKGTFPSAHILWRTAPLAANETLGSFAAPGMNRTDDTRAFQAAYIHALNEAARHLSEQEGLGILDWAKVLYGQKSEDLRRDARHFHAPVYNVYIEMLLDWLSEVQRC
jgi:hypothetical protein